MSRTTVGWFMSVSEMQGSINPIFLDYFPALFIYILLGRKKKTNPEFSWHTRTIARLSTWPHLFNEFLGKTCVLCVLIVVVHAWPMGGFFLIAATSTWSSLSTFYYYWSSSSSLSLRLVIVKPTRDWFSLSASGYFKSPVGSNLDVFYGFPSGRFLKKATTFTSNFFFLLSIKSAFFLFPVSLCWCVPAVFFFLSQFIYLLWSCPNIYNRIRRKRRGCVLTVLLEMSTVVNVCLVLSKKIG